MLEKQPPEAAAFGGLDSGAPSGATASTPVRIDSQRPNPICQRLFESTVAAATTGGGGKLVREETCLEKFRTPNSGAIFPITFNDCGAIFPILFFGHQVQNLYPVLGGGMIGGRGCRIKYVMWMDGLVRICVVCLAAVNTAAINTGFYPSGHFRLPTTCSCQLIVSAVSTDTVFSVGRSL